MQCEFALLHLCLPLDVEAIGIKRAEGMVQAKEDREGRKAETQNRKQVLSEEPLQTVERTTVKWPEENTMQVFNKHNCDLGSREGEQCPVPLTSPCTAHAAVPC